MPELRPPTLADLQALLAYLTEMEEAQGAGGILESDLRDKLTSSHARPEENYRLALDEGRIVGYIVLWQPEPSSDRVFVDPRVHPRDLDVYRTVLEWAEERARRMVVGPKATVYVSTVEGNDVLAAEMRERGYALVRHFLTMEVDLAEEPPDPAWPDGVDVRTFEPGDEGAVYDADIESFEDHWNSVVVPFEDWREYFLEGSGFDPALWFLAWDGDELAGFSLCWSERRPNIGHVGVLGVRRAWRRKGLGKALLLHSFRELRRRGRPRTDLGVDAENLTGAVRLYEAVGMKPVKRFDTYCKSTS